MLHFHGLEYFGSNPKKFIYQIRLIHALNRVSHLYLGCNSNLEQVEKHTNEELDKIFNKSAKLKDKIGYKQKTQEILLIKNICKFLSKHPIQISVIFKLINVLILKSAIESKWEDLVKIIYLNENIWPHNLINEEILDNSSLLNEILIITRLVFLEQISELPPTNLKLYFIPNNFPNHYWISTELNSYVSVDIWTPKQIHCSITFLQQSLWQKINKNILKNNALNVENKSSNIIYEDKQSEKFNQFFNESDEIIIKLPNNQTKNNKVVQLNIIEARNWEKLELLQERIIDEFKLKGILIFFAILRQLASWDGIDKFVYFDVNKHLKLIGLTNLSNESKKEKLWKTTLSIFDLISKVEIIRIKKGIQRYLKNSLVLVWGSKGENYKKSIPTQLLVLPDFVFVNSRTVDNSGLGGAFYVLNENFFSEKIPIKYSGIIKIYPYLCTRWIVDFNKHQGVSIESIKSLVEGSGIYVAKSAKYRIIYKIQSILRFMKEKNYIADYKVDESNKSDPWKTKYTISANNLSIEAISQLTTNNNKIT